MADDARAELSRKLDLLLSIYRAELDEVALSEVLYATANGLIALLERQAQWNAEDRVVELPYTDAGELEAHLEDLLSTKIVCVPVEGDVPPQTSVGIRIVCGSEHVELQGRMIQQTAAGTVLQLEAADVGVQRALVGLPAILRSNPIAPLKVDRDSQRRPQLVDAVEAQESLFPEPEPMSFEKTFAEDVLPSYAPAAILAAAAALGDVQDTIEQRAPFVPQEREPLPEPEPEPASLVEETDAEDRAAASRLAFNLPKIDAAVARATTRNHFDFLAVHFSADTAELAERRAVLVELIKTCRADDHLHELTARLDQLEARTAEAWKVVSDPTSRRQHRAEVVPPEQIEAALQMYEGSAEAAKMSRKIDIAMDCLRRIVELQPDNHEARRQLEALEHVAD